MKDDIISFETAKLAKEKGFNELVTYFYDVGYDKNMKEILLGLKENYNKIPLRHNKKNGIYSASTQSLLQKWLREEYSIFIEVMIGTPNNFSYIINYNYKSDKNNDSHSTLFIDYNDNNNIYKSYEEALDKALQEGLKLIEI